MKKIIAAAAIFAATVAGAFAWTNNFGAGFTVPISELNAKTTSAKDISEVGFGVNAFYMGFADSGFTVKTDINAGAMTSKDVSVQKDETNVGSLSGGSLGLGWTFVKTEKATVSLLGMFGVDGSVYTDKKEDVSVGSDKYKYIENAVTNVTFNIGGDLHTSYKLSTHFGLFANVSVRYVIGGISMNSVEKSKEENGTTKLEKESYNNKYNGGFKVQPTLGVCWRF